MKTYCSAAALWLLVSLAQGAEFEDLQKKSFAIQPGSQLVVDVDRGSVDIETSANNEVIVEVRRKMKNVEKSTAEQIFRDHEIAFAQEPNKVQVRAQFKTKPASRAHNQLQVSYAITVPKKFDLDLRTHGGSITTGDLNGEVKARTSAGAIKLGHIEGPVSADTAGGSIKLASAKTAELETSAGGIEVGRVAGDVQAVTRGGSIRIDEAAKIVAKTSAGSIKIGEATGDILANTSGGSIKINKAKGNLIAKTSAGSIDIERAHARVEAISHGGSITAGLQVKGDCHLETSAGSIKLSLPEKVAVDLDAKASAGSISADFPVATEGKKSKQSLTGKINGGGHALVLRTHAGSISIKKEFSLAAERE